MEKKHSSKELKAQMDDLCVKLEEALKLETEETTARMKDEDEQHRALLSKMIGRRVIMLAEGELKGQEAVIAKPHGRSKKPMHWWFRVVSTGEERCKAATSFRPLKKTKASENKEE